MDWITRIDKNTEDFIRTFGSLTTEEMNWKPNSDAWSIAQNIDHLIVINETYYPTLRALQEGTYKPPFIAKFGFIVSFLGKTVLKSVQPDRKKKIKTFKIWEPESGHIPEGTLERLKRHQAELKEHMESSADLINQKTIISSPANRNIVYKLETAFDIIVTHEQRHFEQAKEVLNLMRNQASR